MKKTLLALLMLVILITTSSAQSPQSIPYQAVARNASGNLLVNQPVSLRFTIHETSGSGTVDYEETQSATTNNLGLFSVNIGAGSRVSGSPLFNSIPWSNSVAKFQQVEIDPTGGNTYVDMGAAQMMSVPYALFAGSASSVPLTAGSGIAVSGDQVSETLPFTSLTTAGNNGTATISSGALNIPGYTLAGLGGIGLTALSANAPLSYNNTSGAFSISQAATGTNGYLSSTDWNTFNSKEPAITAGTTTQYWRGDKTWQTLNTSVVPEGTNLYHTNARAIGSTLTGYASTTGTITASDNILSAIEKLNGNLGSLVSGVSSVNGNTGAVALTGSSSISISAADVFSINSTYSGQNSITTLGTVGTGTWNGTAVGATYGGTGLNTSGSTGFPYVNSGTWSVISAATALTNLGALSTTSFNTAVSGTTGQVTYFNGTNSVTGSANHTWANATNELSVGLSSTTANPSLAVVGANAGGGVVTSTNSSTTAASSGIYGAETGAGTTYGVEGANSGNGGTGVYGLNNSTGTGSQYGVYGSKTGATGTGTGYGVYGTATGTAATNIAGYFTSSGGTANYGIIVPIGGGSVGIGTSSPIARVDVQGTTARSGTALAFTPSMYVTGTLPSGTTGPSAGDIEFRHDNQTQGIGFGFQSIFATSSSTTAGSQPLNILSAGSSPITLNAYPYSTGYVGIGPGNTSPYTTLDVLGNFVTSLHANSSEHSTTEQGSFYIGHQAGSNWGSDGFSGMKVVVQGGNAGCGNTGDIAFMTWQCNTSSQRSVMYVTGGGYVGIGSSFTTPTCPLDVEASTSISSSGYSYGLSNGNGPNEGYNSAEAVSIRTNQNILCGGALLALSDARIKNIKGHSDAVEDLATLNKIKITDYTMRDELSYGHRQYKKVIAQEVKEVYPLAVKTCPMAQIIPNIYANAEGYAISGNEVIINMPAVMIDTNIKVGVTCKFYMNDKEGKEVEEKGTISAFSGKQLNITTEKPLNRSDYNDKLFVYGTEIHDLLSVDYDAISMLNVSATQEIAKRLAAVEAENAKLKSSNASLQNENATLKSSKADVLYVNQLKAQLDELKTLMEKNGIRSER